MTHVWVLTRLHRTGNILWVRIYRSKKAVCKEAVRLWPMLKLDEALSQFLEPDAKYWGSDRKGLSFTIKQIPLRGDL